MTDLVTSSAGFAPAALIGRAIERRDIADAHRLDSYGRLFGLDRASDVALALHWLLFTGLPEQRRGDGHAAVMEPFPALPFPRRMWAGGEVRWLAPIEPGAALVRTSTIASAAAKSGASGNFLLASLDHRIVGNGITVIEERQDIVFLPPVTGPGGARPRPASIEPAWEERRSFDEVTLFTYSALTLNGHRIHYDRPYAEAVEHYPGLVVQGPMLATTLMHAAVRHRAGRMPVRFAYRAVAPSFAGEEIRLVGTAPADGVEEPLAIIGPAGDLRMTATMAFENGGAPA